MSRIIPLLVGLGLLLASEFLHGRWTNRWTTSGALEAACARLPKRDESLILGDWKGMPGSSIRDQDLVIGEIAGYYYQVFTNSKGYAIHVLIVCGRPGPIAVHSPEICLGGEGFDMEGAKKRQSVAVPSLNQPAEFWVSQFYRYEGGIRRDRRQFWTFSPNGSWTADDNPRLNFAGFPALYKIYVMRELSRKDEKLEEDPILDFIKFFMPEIQKRLFSSPSAWRRLVELRGFPTCRTMECSSASLAQLENSTPEAKVGSCHVRGAGHSADGT